MRVAPVQSRILPDGAAGGSRAAGLPGRIVTDVRLTRRMVSYQGNRGEPGLRWMRYKEGFSAGLVRRLLGQTGAERVLDPFSGIGTTVLTASSMGMQSVGIDVMPVGNAAARAVAAVANDVDVEALRRAAGRLAEHVAGGTGGRPFEHVRITRGAFPRKTEEELGRARSFIGGVGDDAVRAVLDFACMSVLEEVSYTSKDGQFLRWDRRSGRDVADRLRKPRIPTLGQALRARLGMIVADAPALRERYCGPRPSIHTGSSLTGLRGLRGGSFDAVVTSPPYANRYDYTRTYALELAYMGYGEEDIRGLRQDMLTATVENRPKGGRIAEAYGRSRLPAGAARAAAECGRLQDVLARLRGQAGSLNNPNIVRLVENYFAEMALVIAELGRLVRRGGDVFMVNDNVRYHGTDVPVDLILSEFAERSGFRCESIRSLRRGKGNSSQQMGRFGRSELRKCVYHWTRP